MSGQSGLWLGIAAVLGAAGVALGAFGAHALPGWLAQLGFQDTDAARRIDIFETGVRYHLIHAVALALTALVLDRTPTWSVSAAAWAFLLGVLVFSGLLYALTLVGENYRWLGAIVPLGGLSMIAGWLLLAVAAFSKR